MRKGHEHVAIDPTPEENDLHLLPGEVMALGPVGTTVTIEWMQAGKGGTIAVNEGSTADAIAALDYLRAQILERSADE